MLQLYVLIVSAFGVAGAAAAFINAPWSVTLQQAALWSTLFMAAAAIAGELKPVMLARGSDTEKTLSTSAPFVLALMAVAGVGVAVLVQVIASVADDIRLRRPAFKSFFNNAQYVLSILGARGVYVMLTGEPFFGGPMVLDLGHIAALIAAGIAMFVINWVLVAIAVSLASSQPLGAVLREDGRDFLATNVVLLSVGGIAADVASDGLLVLSLLAVPVVAAHVFAAAAARHAYDATHDSLTGLGNRGQLHHDLTRALEGARQSDSEGPGLVMFDLDHFKDFNDTLGHPVGDEILRQVAERLVGAAPENASVHRLGGDEFAVVVRDDLVGSQRVAQQLLASLDAPVRIESLELLVRASAGLAVAPLHGADGEELMKNVDIALYHAKLERDRISTYSPEFDINTVERLQLLADLRTALDANQLHVVYQPQVDLNSGRTVAAEALVRWEHPERGFVRPDEFIPLAENSGLIYRVTAVVLEDSLRELARWRGDGHDVRVSVNLSARHLSDLALPHQVADALDRHRLPPHALVLEVTETGILSDPVRADVVIRALRQLGVEVAIDDYGTGNASLNYLRRLEIDELKIDRSFVSNIRDDDHDLIIVRSTIALALALGLRVVAEGIEDQPTVESLRVLGGVIGQGYHLGRPAPAADMVRRLEAERSAPVSGRGRS